MSGKVNPLEQPQEPVDAHGQTREEAVAQEIERNGEVLNDWLNAKDRQPGGIIGNVCKYEPTPKTPGTSEKVVADPATQTPAEKFRGRPRREGRVQPKEGAHKFPRTKFNQNDPSSGWGK